MKDTPNAIIVLGNGTVFEQKLADQQSGHKLPNSLTVVSNVVTDGQRTVVVTRPLKGKTAEHYTFSLSSPEIKFINAVGKTPNFSCECISPPLPVRHPRYLTGKPYGTPDDIHCKYLTHLTGKAECV